LGVPKNVLVDTGPLVAVLSKQDQYHNACVEQLKELHPPLFTCWPVLTEAVWLLRHWPDAVQRLFHSFDQGLYELLEIPQDAMPEIAKLLKNYSDQGAQLADAALVYLANEHSIRTIFTVDSDFHVYRGKRNRVFQLLP
jgi:predicted nucleic acid-binding protein